MPRYIDADFIKTGLKQEFCTACSSDYENKRQCCVACDIAYAMSLIDETLTADVEPVRHGRWEDYYVGDRQEEGFICTVCLEPCKCDFDFCPNCGSKMDEGVEND